MASSMVRRPLPALIGLLALLLLTALVWWRVLNRDSGTGEVARKACPTAVGTASATLPPPASVDVLVLNATTRTGIAGKARKTLLTYGFKSPGRAANDLSKRKVLGTAEIRYGPAGKDAAALVRYYFPAATMIPTRGGGSTVTVALGPKYTKVASQAAVRAALAGDKARIATAPPSARPTAKRTCAS